MILHRLQSAPSSTLRAALNRFEARFRYPLGPGRSFRINHGDDYPRFFRAMGNGLCFAIESHGEIIGVIGAALRSLNLPDGSTRTAAYLGDVKIDPAARGGPTLFRLAKAVQAWAAPQAQAAFGVMMEGTPVPPTRYTGRLGIPLFSELGRITILRLPTRQSTTDEGDRWLASADQLAACHARLTASGFSCPGGDSTLRSEMTPDYIAAPDGEACGLLEDTRRAKRLFADDGSEMRSAHLSEFAYAHPHAGAALIRAAMSRAAQLGFPNLFVSIPHADTLDLLKALGIADVVTAPAIIYGAALEPGPPWYINTSEI